MIPRILRLAGLLIFALAFALPAVRLASSDAPTIIQPGWMCAMVATAASGSLVHHAEGSQFSGDISFSLPLILSGWVNPLFLLALVLGFWRQTILTRRILGGVILVCYVATWVFFVRAHVIPAEKVAFWS